MRPIKGIARQQTALKLLHTALRKLEREPRPLYRRQLFPIDPLNPKAGYELQTFVLKQLCAAKVVKRIARGAADVSYEVQNKEALHALLGQDEERSRLLWPSGGLGEPHFLQSNSEEEEKVSGSELEASTSTDEASDRELLEEILVMSGLSAKNIVFIRDRVLGIEKRLDELKQRVEIIEKTTAEILDEWRPKEKSNVSG